MQVLILIILEVGIESNAVSVTKGETLVLILIILEVGIEYSTEALFVPRNRSLNPYYSGSRNRIILMEIINMTPHGLNPYYSGSRNRIY